MAAVDWVGRVTKFSAFLGELSFMGDPGGRLGSVGSVGHKLDVEVPLSGCGALAVSVDGPALG